MKFDWFEWFALLLIIIIANAFIWLTPGPVASRLFGCALATIFPIGTFAYIKAWDM